MTGSSCDTGAAAGGATAVRKVSEPGHDCQESSARQPPVWWCRGCEGVGVRVSFKAAPLPRSHLLDSSCLNTTQAPIRV